MTPFCHVPLRVLLYVYVLAPATTTMDGPIKSVGIGRGEAKQKNSVGMSGNDKAGIAATKVHIVQAAVQSRILCASLFLPVRFVFSKQGKGAGHGGGGG